MTGNLYLKHNYLNKDCEYLVSYDIIEYDIRDAGFSIIKENKLLDDSTIAELQTMTKMDRKIQIGKIQKNNKQLVKNLNAGFVEMRRRFVEANNVQDEEILSIKKDAIIMLRRCSNTLFGEVEFAEKNIYTSYYYINKCEFYIANDHVDVKGINDDLLANHRDYMLSFIFKFAKLMETTNRQTVIKFIMDFATKYMTKELDIGYYRELNSEPFFTYAYGLKGEYVGLSDVGDLEDIDISYNYTHFIVPLVSILV